MKKLAKAVLVETKDKSVRGDLNIAPTGLGIHVVSVEPSFHNKQHLYIISLDPEEKIEKGEWFYDTYSKNVGKAAVNFGRVGANTSKKIIASNNKSLNLPQPSPKYIQQFIEEYNAGGVKDIKVEYTTPPGICLEKLFPIIPRLTNNFISIHPIESIDVYKALEACLEKMEQLRVSGDAGNWEWEEGDAYSNGTKALNNKKK